MYLRYSIEFGSCLSADDYVILEALAFAPYWLLWLHKPRFGRTAAFADMSSPIKRIFCLTINYLYTVIRVLAHSTLCYPWLGWFYREHKAE
jgi:hypothetical protein